MNLAKVCPVASRRESRTLWGVSSAHAVTVVVTRRTSTGHEVAVVGHRRRRAWELVRGRVCPGELPAAAAARETLEETGFAALSVCRVGSASTATRTVFVADVTEGLFQPSREIRRLVWADRRSAATLLSRREQRVLSAALRKLSRRPLAAELQPVS